MMGHRSTILASFAVAATATILLASSGVITVISTNQASNEPVVGVRWEPSSAAGSTWATSWAAFPDSNPNSFNSYVSAWNGSAWGTPTTLIAPNGQSQGDVNLAYDSVRSRFVFVTLDGPGGNVWYGFSSDSSGTSWTFKSTAIFPSSLGTWDYPSIGVDASGRVIVGAVRFPGPTGYFAVVSSDGINFSSPIQVGSMPGAQSRVAATNNVFEAFVPTLNAQFLPTAVSRYESSDGITWSGPFTLATFGAPLNNGTSSSGTNIFYAPLLAAQGYTNGLWVTAFQVNNGGFNNVYICTADRGCGLVNAAADDQFLTGTSVSGDAGYWVGYYAYSTLNTRDLPLIKQAIYFPSGQPAIGATTNTNIDPTSWQVRFNRCTTSCYAAGDFNTVSSNPFAASHHPFIQQSSRHDDLFQSFVQDPQATPNVPNFKPNFIPYPTGADLTTLATILPAAVQTALPPARKIGIEP